MRNVFLQRDCLGIHHESWNNQAIAPKGRANKVVDVGMGPFPDMVGIIGGCI